jgi:hypothetical protein
MGGIMRRGAAVALVVALGLGPGGPATADPGAVGVAAAPSPPADRALAELAGGAGGGAGVAALPRFREAMGYTPGAVRPAGGVAPRAVKPDGACSSPIGATWFDFGWPCKAHDLGYDLLRYADRGGLRLDPDARRRLDDRFALDLHDHCAATRTGLARRACDAVAWVYAGVARLNSWRQQYGTP